MDLGFHPEIEQFLLFPPLDELKINSTARNRIGFRDNYDNTPNIFSNLLFMLLGKDKNVNVDNVQLTSDEWLNVLKIMSVDNSDRTVQLAVTRSTIARWMRDCKITQACKAHQIVGDFTNLQASSALLELRYRKCWISIQRFAWKESDLPALVELTNFEKPTADMLDEFDDEMMCRMMMSDDVYDMF
ncbi:hypothetical protein PENTCL1PPCAC_7699 [Pristionchus entomophagus]|uniref:Uncharacterized protein n=1 Tax=Pristionchus entomophagus TaxID=358040 RepID=A0AAV5SZ13_9BILA|nr:hypothetical protein PENTCL1PPCAC_7699 [Pristionchus entomophagus]